MWQDTNISEDGGNMGLLNVGILAQHCTASQPRRPGLETVSKFAGFFFFFFFF
jgi:hypothetical protein